MSSILTNNAAMVALQTLKSISTNLDQTNNRVSTGLRIATAADNAAYWSIATTVRSDNGALSAVNDALGIGKSTIDTVGAGLDTVHGALEKIKQALVTASAPEADRGKVQATIASQLAEIASVARNTVSGGVSWLSVDSLDPDYAATKKISAAFSRTGNTVAVESIDVDSSTIKLYDANATVHTAVGAAVTVGAAAYATSKGIADTAYATNTATADTTYVTALGAADTVFAASGQLAADVITRDAAYSAAQVAKDVSVIRTFGADRSLD